MDNLIAFPNPDSDVPRMPSPEEFFDADDYAFIENLANYWEDGGKAAAYVPFTDDGDLASYAAELADAILSASPYMFEQMLESDAYGYYGDPTFARLVVLGLEYGVACGDGACANYLGAMYYMGDVVGQDYFRAKELYEIAEKSGSIQAMVNLGYIYEYGRTGEPDHLRAFMQYAKVVALCEHFEAYYKMGDMYSRAKVVERDLHAAYRLYERSLKVAVGDVQKAQPAIRIAKLISDPDNTKLGIPYDPMRALELYQLAERGLRVDIANGATYYRRRLEEAISGQELMRAVLDGNDGFR